MRGSTLLVALTLVIAACGDDAVSVAPTTTPSTGTTTTPTTLQPSTSAPAPAAPLELILETDLPYYETAAGAVRHLDVYRPTDGSGHRLVVVFHANPVFGNTKANVEQLATLIAERGAVVVAPTYGETLSMFDMGAIAMEAERWFVDEGTCAVWAAVELAEEVGADPGLLTLVGDVTGSGPTHVATFRPPDEVEGCLAPPATADVETAILFETDRLWTPDIWDDVIRDDPGFMERMQPWDPIAAGGDTKVFFLSGEREDANTVRSLDGVPYLDSEWVRLRDPDGELTEYFDELGLLDDGLMSFSDTSRVAIEVLKDAGWAAEFAVVPGVGHSLSTPESKEFIADLVFADPPS